MMKRFLGIALVISMLFSCAALAAELTDAPGMLTQDAAISATARMQDENKTAYDLYIMTADQQTMDQVSDAYTFIYEQDNRPVRWFPEETQRVIETLVDNIDPDAMHMTEFMRLHVPQSDTIAALDVVMKLKSDYQPGQQTVIVLGDISDPEHIVWTPLKAEVTEVGQLEFVIPQSLMAELHGKDVIFTLLTVRPDEGGYSITKTIEEIPEVVPSKQAGDNTRIVKITDEYGNPPVKPFELVIVPETELIKQELALLNEHVNTKQKAALAWLPEDKQDEISYLLGDKSEDMLIADYVPLITRGYDQTNGDAIATFAFATPYQAGQTVVTVLGLPREDTAADGETLMDWVVQRATVQEDGTLDIVFNQLSLVGMGTETGLMLVYGEPVAQ